jgi:hypothetical protein
MSPIKNMPSKNMPSKPSKLKKPVEYAEFLRGIQLIALALKGCSLQIERDAYFKVLGTKAIERHISTDYKLVESGKDFFNAAASFALTVATAKSKAHNVLSIDCIYEAHFHCSGCEIQEDHARRFTESELRVVVWPYFREFAQDVSAKMAIPPLLIPFSSARY